MLYTYSIRQKGWLCLLVLYEPVRVLPSTLGKRLVFFLTLSHLSGSSLVPFNFSGPQSGSCHYDPRSANTGSYNWPDIAHSYTLSLQLKLCIVCRQLA